MIKISKKKSLDEASLYQKKVNMILNKLAETEYELAELTAVGESTTKLENQLHAIIFDLENFGVVSEERFLQNPDYWAERVYNAQLQIQRGEEVSVSLEDKTDPTLYNIHTDDVSLKTQAQISYVCYSFSHFGIPIYCMNIDVEWGGGSTAYAKQWLNNSDQIYTYAKTCLENDGDHNRVYFSFDSKHYTTHSWQGTVWEVVNQPQDYYLSHNGTCVVYDENTYGTAGFYAHTKAHLDETITIS